MSHMIPAGSLSNFDTSQVFTRFQASESAPQRLILGAQTGFAPPHTFSVRMTDTTPTVPGSRKLLVDLLILLALVVLGVAGYMLAPLLTPQTDVSLPVSSCDLGKTACMIELPDGGRVEVAIDPHPILALKPLKLLAVASGAEVRQIEIDFTGVDMKMGFNRPKLEALGGGRFAGQASLPVCITGKMPWEATVLIETRRSIIAAPFRFEAEGH